MNVEKGLKIFSFILTITGYTILAMNDWKIGVAVFIIHWAINFDRKD